MAEPTNGSRVVAPWKAACAVTGLYLLVIAAAAALMPCPAPQTHGTRLVLCLFAIEAVALAVAVPFLAARSLAATRWRARLLLALAPVLGMELSSIVLFAAAARGSVPLAVLLWAHLFLLAFAWLMAALTATLAACRLRAGTAQAAATFVGLAMLGQVFFANSLIEAATTERGKMLAIDAVVWSNPWLIVGGSILQADPLRSENLYKWSVIIYYGFRYPGSSIAAVGLRSLFLAAAYALVAGAFDATAWLLHRRARRAEVVQRVDTLCPH